MNLLPGMAELIEPLVDEIDDLVRAGWELQWRLQGRRTASILRYIQTGGDAALGVAPALQRVAGLDALPVVVHRGRLAEAVAGSRARGPQTQYRFVFYGTQVLLTDRIEFDGSVYEVGETDWNPSTGRCSVTARRVGPAGP